MGEVITDLVVLGGTFIIGVIIFELIYVIIEAMFK